MKKLLIPMLLAILLLPVFGHAQTHYTLQLGSGTETNQYLPDYGYYNYAYSQMLYTAGDVGVDGAIDSLSFQVSSGSLTRSVSIYMAEVSATSFPSTASAVSAADFHLVYTGSVTYSTGWVNIALDSIFNYSDTGSLVIALIDQTGSYSSAYPYYYGTAMSNNRSLYAYNDNNAYTLSSSLSSSSTFLPNIRLGISTSSVYCARPTDVAVNNIVNTQATVTWHESGSATSWELVVSDTVVTDFSLVTPIAVTDTTYTLTDLDGNTAYYVYVRAICSSTSTSGWTNGLAFRSACIGSTDVPYATGFEDVVTGELPNCWQQVAMGSSSASTFPSAYEYSSNAHNSNVYFEFESNNGETEIAAMPEMDNISSLYLSFYASVMNVNFTFEVGVMEDSVFVPVDTVALTPGVGNNWGSSYHPYTVYFTDYTGYGNRIAMRVTPMGNSYTLMLDDFVVDEVPNCLPPARFRVDSISSTWAALGWREVGSASGWQVIYDTVPFNPDSTLNTPVSATDTMLVLEDLSYETTYYAYLRADCGDYSPWVGPLTFVPGHYIMGYSGSDTIRTCGMTIYDEAGEEGAYNVGSDFTVVVYPSSEDSVVTFWGSTDIYSYNARLRIYEGVGTNGPTLWQSSSGNNNDVIPFTRSYVGPITVRFTAGNYNYGYTGFELHTGCDAAPGCATVNNLTADNVGVSSAHLVWNVTGINFGNPIGYEVECIDVATDAVVSTNIAEGIGYTVTGLTAATEYKIRVSAVCDNDESGIMDSTYITTGHLPCLAYDTTLHDSLTVIGLSATTTYQLPVNNYYNNSFTQQLVLSGELTGSTVINGIDFDYAYSSSNTDKTNCTIYLANVVESSLLSDYVPYDSNTFQMVYSGSLVCNTGWNHFEFSTPFEYDGSKNLLVTVVDNSGDYNSSSYVFNAHSVSGLSRYSYSDGVSYDITQTPGGSTSAGTFRSNMRFHIAGCAQELTCARPTVVVESVTSNQVDLSWAPGYQETSWSVEYRADTDTVWTDEGVVNINSYAFTSLVPDTRYWFRISSLCSDTTMYTELTLRTQCVADTLPFAYSFEDFGTTGPACWYAATDYAYGTYPAGTTSYAHSGSSSVDMYSSSSSYCYFVLPVLNAPVDSLEVTFWMFRTYDESPIDVGVMTDPEDINTFYRVATVYSEQSNVWKVAQVKLNSYRGTGNRIAIVSPSDSYVSLYIDDITVDYIRPCGRVENVAVSNITTDSAMVTWNGGGNSQFEMEYGPAGFAHDSGMVVATTVDTVILSGLTPNTAYDVYVRTFCDDGDTSAWSNVYSFRTDCLMLTTLPFTEDFESVPTGWGSDYTENFLPCWTRAFFSGTDYTYPYVYNWGGHSGSYDLYWYWSSYNNYSYTITLPAVDTNVFDMDSLQLKFWAINSSTYADAPTFYVGVMTDPTLLSTFQVVDTVEVNDYYWTRYEVPLDRYTGNGNYIAIMAAPTVGSGYWYAEMDDITIEPIPSCPHVGNLAMTSNTATSVTLGWTERGDADTWQVSTTSSPTATPVADTTISDTTSITINGLTSAQEYYFWVRAICGAGDTSEWEGPLQAIPNSWCMRPNMTDTVYMCHGVVFDDGGPLRYFSDGQNSTLVIMPVDSTYVISVSGESYTSSTYSYLTIYDGAGTTGPILWTDNGLSNLSTFGPFVSNGGPITLNFYSYNSSMYDGFSVNVECLTTHCRVMNVQLNPSVPQSANQLALTWNNNGALYYQVEYDTIGFTQGSGTMLTTYTNSIVIPGLSQLGKYDVYLRSVCGAGDTGDWVHYTFQTALCDGMNSVESFNASMTSSTTSYAPIGYSYYDYSFVQTIIDSAQLAELGGDISAFAFHPASDNAGTYFTNITVYMANVPESDLSAGYILPDSAHQFVKVLDSADLSYYNSEWQIHALDTTFAWDGHSNLLFVTKRDNGSWSSGSMFNAHNTTAPKTRYSYRDGNPFDFSIINSVNSYTGNYVADLKFYSCNAVACPQPVINSITYDYESATVNWSGTGSTYQINIKDATAAAWPTPDIVVTGNTYTFNALQPATSYTVRLRQDCSADSLGYSEWVIGGFVTDSLPCLAPDSLHAVSVTNSTATLDWNVNGTETAWNIRVWFAGFDSVYTVTTRPATIGGFIAGVTYNAAIRPLCGTAHNIIGDWSAPVTFTTAVCPNVTGLTSSNVTANTITLNWTADPMAQSWVIEYGYYGFDQGTGITVTTTTNSYVFNGLEPETDYDFYVKAVCGTDWLSENWVNTQATTLSGGVVCGIPTNVVVVPDMHSAIVSWTAGEGNNSYELEYGPNGFSHGSGVTALSDATTYNISGLSSGTEYDVYVRALCDEGVYSDWSAVASFMTGIEGIDDVAAAACTIYPNPASNSTTISVSGVNGKVKIEVVDMNGRAVATETLECSSDCTKTMDVDNLAQGAYFVRVTGDSVNMVKKLIVR